jgi:hypothetical protein
MHEEYGLPERDFTKFSRYIPLVYPEDGDRTVSSKILVSTYQITQRHISENCSFITSVAGHEDRRSVSRDVTDTRKKFIKIRTALSHLREFEIVRYKKY